MTERVLRVPFRQQNTGYYCGPATIEMILLYRKISKTQHDLWDDVQANSICKWDEELQSPNYLWVNTCPCWATSPEAESAVINLHLPNSVRTRYAATAADGVKYLVGSIDANLPPAATIYGFNHWVVVQGYRLDPPEAGSPDLTVEGLYVMDPGQPWKAVRYRLIPLDDWTDNVFGSMTCGTHEDDYPVVVG